MSLTLAALIGTAAVLTGLAHITREMDALDPTEG